MPSSNIWLWAFILAPLASSSVLQHRAQNKSDNDLFFATVPDDAIESLGAPPLNISWSAAQPLNVTPVTATSRPPVGLDLNSPPLVTPICNGHLFGFNLDFTSCHGAWKMIPRDTIARTFGARGTGIFDMPTPYLFMSSNGLCALELDMQSDDPLETATGYDIAINGLNIFRTCVQGNPSEGGMTPGVGHSGRLLLEMRAYSPASVHCMDAPAPAPAPAACRATLNLMPASVDPQKFGLRDEPNVEVELPKAFTASANGRCIITVSTTGPSSISTWYALYAAATAIDAMCVRPGKAGYATALGDSGSLVLSIKADESGGDVAATA